MGSTCLSIRITSWAATAIWPTYNNCFLPFSRLVTWVYPQLQLDMNCLESSSLSKNIFEIRDSTTNAEILLYGGLERPTIANGTYWATPLPFFNMTVVPDISQPIS